MLKKILNKVPKATNPITRNIIVIIGVIAALAALALAATIVRALFAWIWALGWKILLTIAVTTIICGVIFGYAEMRRNGEVIVFRRRKDEDESFEEFVDEE